MFHKTINLIYLLLVTFVYVGGLHAQVENMNVTESGQPTNKKLPRDDVYDRKQMTERKILEYDFLDEKDVMWEKRIWRLIDFREKRNQHFKYKVAGKSFIEILLRGLNQGKLLAYKEQDFAYEFTNEEIQKKLNSVDTIEVFDYDNNTYETKIIPKEFDPNNAKQLRIKEVWFFDEEASDLDVRILGLAPIVDNTDRNGNVVSTGPLFWFYYPDMREFLAVNASFNEGSDVDMFSWEDVFENRLFSSYIIQDSNVYDRRIQDYKTVPLDALFEAEKIKDGIFHMEHDVWDY